MKDQVNISNLVKYEGNAHSRAAGLNDFCNEVFGAHAVVEAMQQLAGGAVKVAKFAVSDHPVNGGAVKEIFTIGFADIRDYDDEPEQFCFRYCGENDEPDGSGSHSVIGSGHSFSDDPAYAAAALCFLFGRRGECIFRLAV
jgi:hypothetical protein